jgi:sugar lactone lactonase YvrE
MDYYNSLVAGGGDAGYEDGPFYQARFDHPSGLAFDDTGDRLFVADQGNHRIRVIHLNDNNRVETLAGSGSIGRTDGPLLQAAFDAPTALAWIPPDHLAVYDQGDGALRLIDLKTKTVTTLGTSTDGKSALKLNGLIGNLYYRLLDDSLYFTIPSQGALEKMDLISQKITTVISNDPKLPNPLALYSSKAGVYIADQNLPSVYRIEFSANTMNTQAGFSLLEVGKGDQILSLVETDGILYALQRGACALVRVSNSPQTVSLATPWGFLISSDNPNIVEPLVRLNEMTSSSLATSPTEPRKLYISNPRSDSQCVVSVKDYQFDKDWKARSWQSIDNNLTSVTDFNYPTKKPAKTFRILMIGTSRIVSAGAPGFSKDGGNQEDNSLRSYTLPKTLEFLLNSQASLQDVQTNYEILTLGQPGGAPYIFSHYSVPDLVKKYDIDLILMMETSLDEGYYMDYFLKPLTSEGVPSKNINTEFLLKPYPGRISPGLPRDFYYECELHKMIQKISPTEWVFPTSIDIIKTDNAGLKDKLIEMLSRPLRLFAEKLRSIKGRYFEYPKIILFFTPAENGFVGIHEKLWNEVAVKSQISFLDLTDGYTALRTSYEPVCDGADPSRHYTAYGNLLLAQLLQHYLIDNKFIPFVQFKDQR